MVRKNIYKLNIFHWKKKSVTHAVILGTAAALCYSGSYKFQVGKQAGLTLLKSKPPVIKYTMVLKCLNL